MKLKFRYLTAEDIECRIGSIGKDGSYVTLLLYKDARCDMNILDETVGKENWDRNHYEVKNKDFCRVGINVNFENSELAPRWVYKSDCGTESYSDSEKGEASDAFKRACVNWGIGRELYTAPLIYIPLESKMRDGTMRQNYKFENGKVKAAFRVTCMKVKDGKITGLNIENDKIKQTIYVFGNIFDD